MTRRLSLAAVGAALTAACAPLSMFATFTPKDPAMRSARNVAYGPAAHQRLDVYAPQRSAGQATPVAVFFYGGSWDTGRRQDYSWVGQALASRGFVTVVPDYGLYPAVRYPGFLEDGARAVRWAQDHATAYGGDPGRIVLVGHSAGAYNAAMIALDRRYLTAAGVNPRHIKALAGLSGPYDFLPLTDPIAIRTFGEATDLAQTQPTSFVTSDSPPAFLATGDQDTIVFPRNTVKLAAKLRAAGVEVQEEHYPDIDHVRMVLALSRPFRGRAPVLQQMSEFLHAHAG
ncbi:alpha/beta hydrolase [Phenylobacterium sp.]|jgi:acetyl esterase/lipase|uniref:alpha/beta hydrolase n=1 Tax=Phenylobacterium sp. TaxID=1871053 RepID=UPI002E377582|nr:alpha/beta hydrolase [Phenylobacterium sp.]HEX3363636.1 alpha/beta hydrolase [Phenylobacterium sp.]